MVTQCYSVAPQPISTILAWVGSGEIAIPEIQRPFVWDATDVRDLLDSLYRGYPVGYIITWRNPTVKLKDGTPSLGKRIVIDGQQRITALMAALLGQDVLTKDYETVRIRISFNPLEERFEVFNAAIERDPAWIGDIASLFSGTTTKSSIRRAYMTANPGTNEDRLEVTFETFGKVIDNQIGVIELAPDLDIETVAEIFKRVNSAGSPLSQADFAMSKIAVNEKHGGNTLRKAIDYFCYLAVAPDFHKRIEKNDLAFAETDYYTKMAWLKKENDEIYDPSYTDVLRVAFATEFKRGRLQDLVALLSGRNFETKTFEEEVVEDTFARLKTSVLNFMNETHFKRFVMIIRSAGFVDAAMLGSQNALDAAYILYLTLRRQNIPDGEIERLVRRWFVMSVLTGRYSGSPESVLDFDVRQIDAQGIHAYAGALISGALADAFWDLGLPQAMDTSSPASPYFRVFQAAQVKMNDKGFLSRDIAVHDLITIKSDVHHIFPRDYLKSKGMLRGQYNQIANYVMMQTEINIPIGNKEPRVYFGEILEQCRGGAKRYGNITDSDELRHNLAVNCIPEGMESMTVADYPAFLAARRKLMAQKVKTYFEAL